MASGAPGPTRPGEEHRSNSGSSGAPLGRSGLVFALLLLSAPIEAQEPQIQPGEMVRIDLTVRSADRLRVPSPWEGTFVTLQGQDVVGNHPYSGPVRLPLDAIERAQVERRRSTASAVAIGIGAGSGLGLGMWQFLGVLCGSGCDTGDASTWGPAILTGVLVGVLVGARSASGVHWVDASFRE